MLIYGWILFIITFGGEIALIISPNSNPIL
jgi:hypothetical protein